MPSGHPQNYTTLTDVTLLRAVTHFGPPARVYRYKHGAGAGIWFAWEVGLIVRDDGTEEMDRDPALYAEEIH